MRQGEIAPVDHSERQSGTARRVCIATAFLSLSLVLGACGGPDPEQILASGRQALEKDDPAAAIIHLKGFIEIHPEHHQARRLLGRAYLGTGQANAAEVELRRAIDLGASREQVLPSLARAMLMQGRFQPLLDEIPADIADKTSDPTEVSTVRGLAHVGMNRLAEAQAEFERATARSPEYPDALLGLAHVAIRQQRLDDAATLVDRALKGSPRSVDAWIFKAELMLQLSRADAAAAAYEQLLKIFPDNARANVGLALIRVAQGNLEAVAKLTDAALKASPLDAGALTLRALVAYRKGDGPNARGAIAAALRVRPEDPTVLVLAGAILYSQAEYAESARLLLRVLEKAPRLGVVRKLYGAALIRTGQPLSAIEVLVPTLRLRPQDPTLLGLIAEAYARSGDLANAREHVVKGLAQLAAPPAKAETPEGAAIPAGLLRPSDIDIALAADANGEQMGKLLALIHIRQREFAPALKLLADIEQARGPDPVLYTLKGAALSGTNDLPAARKVFEQALALRPEHVPAAFNLSVLDLREGDTLSARRRLEKLVNRRADDIDALIALMTIGAASGATEDEISGWLKQARDLKTGGAQALVLLGHHYLRRGDAKLAHTVAAEAYALAKQDLGVLRLLGTAQLANGEPQNAVTTFSQLLSARPTSPEALRLLGKAHLAGNNTAAALLLLRKAQSLSPAGNPDILLDIAEAELRSGRTASALDNVRAAQKAAPKATRAFVLEGDILMALGKPAEARASYEQALARRQTGEATIRMHLALDQLGQHGQAADVLERWLQGSPEDAPVRSFFGSFLLQQGRYKEAVAEFQAVLQLQPKDPEVLNNLAWALAQLKDDRAQSYAEKAYALNQNDPAILDTLGWMLVERGDLARGIELLERAVTLDSAVPQVRYHLAQAYVRSGNRARARRELELLLTFPKFSEAPAVKKLLADLNR